MVKMEKENNLQVTFSKRKVGLFKKASELCTLCDARIAVIVFSPSGKVYSFGHTKVETIIERFENNDHPDNNPQLNMQLGEIHQNSTIRGLNNRLTEVTNQLESEQQTSEDIKKLRKKFKIPEIWFKESIGILDLGQAKEFKGKLENLKKQVTQEAFQLFLATPFPHPGFYAGSSSNAPFGNYSNVEGFVPGFNHDMALP
ncbi:Agamous-like MADS-box protein AGL62 [Raphanus sativus]|nr:Agamous-like MADS-box protein AGL62 [Raphanus sativus]